MLDNGRGSLGNAQSSGCSRGDVGVGDLGRVFEYDFLGFYFFFNL